VFCGLAMLSLVTPVQYLPTLVKLGPRRFCTTCVISRKYRKPSYIAYTLLANNFTLRARQDAILPVTSPIIGIDGREIHEILVPKDTTVILLVSIINCNRDPALWGPDSYEWKPERESLEDLHYHMSLILYTTYFTSTTQYQVASLGLNDIINYSFKLPLLPNFPSFSAYSG
jgi:hypothetical protein